jgi:3-isopropylmalate/(R)-2-methylmalate dehydratase small subunit
MIAAEIPPETLDEIFREFSGLKTDLAVDTKNSSLVFSAAGKSKTVPFVLKDFERALVESGGWVEYAAAHY